MKIVLINAVKNGSTGKICNDIKSELPEHDINFYYGINTKNLFICFRWFCNKVISIVFDYDEKIAKFYTLHLIQRLKKIKPDIIHLHNIHGHYINYRMLFHYIKKYNIKVMWTLHDCWSFTGHCAYFDKVNCDKWKTVCYDCPNLHSYPRSLFRDRSKKLYKIKKQTFTGVKNMVLVPPSKWLADLVAQSFLKDYPIKVINNGINLENFSYLDNHSFDNIIDRTKKIVLGVANYWGERKGYGDFIKLSELLDKSAYQIVMAGVDSEQKKELKKYGIIGITRTENQTQLAELYSLAYVFINLTYEDNFPTVNIETLACGCPIITYKTGGSVEVITDYNGMIVEQGNLEQIKNAIDSIESHNYDRNFISQQAKMLYNKKVMAQEYNKIYKELFDKAERKA